MRRGVTTAEASDRLVAYLCHLFPGDANAQAEIRDAFGILQSPALGDQQCANALDALMAMVREILGTYGPVVARAQGKGAFR